MDNRPPGVAFCPNCVWCKVDLEVFQHRRFAGLGLACHRERLRFADGRKSGLAEQKSRSHLAEAAWSPVFAPGAASGVQLPVHGRWRPRPASPPAPPPNERLARAQTRLEEGTVAKHFPAVCPLECWSSRATRPCPPPSPRVRRLRSRVVVCSSLKRTGWSSCSPPRTIEGGIYKAHLA